MLKFYLVNMWQHKNPNCSLLFGTSETMASLVGYFHWQQKKTVQKNQDKKYDNIE